MTNFPMTGPVAPQANPPIKAQFFIPNIFPITAISYGQTTVVTLGTFFNQTNNFVLGQQVRFVISKPNGAQQLDGKTAYVISVPVGNTVQLDIDSRFFDPFNPSPSGNSTPSYLVAIGDVNTGAINQPADYATYINGSFRNISP